MNSLYTTRRPMARKRVLSAGMNKRTIPIAYGEGVCYNEIHRPKRQVGRHYEP